MAEAAQKRLWYVRRAGRVRGPYPHRQISREILLGRIRAPDTLSQDRERWQPLTELPELVPEAMRHPGSAGANERLTLARLREDERQRDRRAGHAAPVANDRRRGDRRNVESFEPAVVHARREGEDESTEGNLLLPVAVVLTAIISLAMYLFWYRPAAPVPVRNCDADAAPAVDWSGCSLPDRSLGRADLREANLGGAILTRADLHAANLLRADLHQANLEAADLHGASLREARLSGAVLRGANLELADLRDADLGFVILEGARLSGAKLDGARLGFAVWNDGRVCAADSIGECR